MREELNCYTFTRPNYRLKGSEQPCLLLPSFVRLNACLTFHNSWFSRRISKIIAVIFTVRNFISSFPYLITSGLGSSVGTATALRAGRSGDRMPVGARFSSPDQTGPAAHPASCTMGTASFPGVKSGRSVTLTPHPF